MERPQPTIEIILGVTGGDEDFLRSTHQGIYELPLDKIYPVENFDGLIVSASGLSDIRSSNDFDSFLKDWKEKGFYNVLNGKINRSGYARLNAHKNIPERLQPLYEELNPYKGRTLRQRIESIDPEIIEDLFEKLKRPVSNYPDMSVKELAEGILDMLLLYPTTYEESFSTGSLI